MIRCQDKTAATNQNEPDPMRGRFIIWDRVVIHMLVNGFTIEGCIRYGFS